MLGKKRHHSNKCGRALIEFLSNSVFFQLVNRHNLNFRKLKSVKYVTFDM
jgi:hypothetical protein